MTAAEADAYRGILQKSEKVVEFGCGGSTCVAIEAGVKNIWSVESDKGWIRKLRKEPELAAAIEDGRLHIQHADIGPTKDWGKPADDSSRATWHRYHSGIWSTIPVVDLNVVFVDGRFRLACALQAVLRVGPDCKIVFHDFWDRERYAAILNYTEVVDRVDTMAVLKARNDNVTTQVLDELFRVVDWPG